MKSANVKKEATGFQLNTYVQQSPFSSVSHLHFNHRLNIIESHPSVFFCSWVRGLVTATLKILKPFILVGRKVFCNRRFEALWIFLFLFFSVALKVVNNSKNIKKCTTICSQGRCINERWGVIQTGGSKITAAKSFFEYIFRSLNINLLSHFSNCYWVLSAVRIEPSICIFFFFFFFL